MSRVLDASVAVKWFVAEAESDAALALIRQALLAPDLIYAEVAHVLWKKSVRKELPAQVLGTAADWLIQAGLHTVPCEYLLRDAIRISRHLSYPAYDCFYLALGLQEDMPLITADARLHARCRQPDAQALGLRVELLGAADDDSAVH